MSIVKRKDQRNEENEFVLSDIFLLCRFCCFTYANQFSIIISGSAFMIGRFLTSMYWGIIADKYGRKPVMVAGVVSV